MEPTDRIILLVAIIVGSIVGIIIGLSKKRKERAVGLVI